MIIFYILYILLYFIFYIFYIFLYFIYFIYFIFYIFYIFYILYILYHTTGMINKHILISWEPTYLDPYSSLPRTVNTWFPKLTFLTLVCDARIYPNTPIWKRTHLQNQLPPKRIVQAEANSRLMPKGLDQATITV